MTCAKKIVICTITTQHSIVYAQNDCNNPQAKCPRLPGEDYTKCKTICDQPGHAEIQALDKAKMMGFDMTGSLAIISGISYVCKVCANALFAAGVQEIRIRR